MGDLADCETLPLHTDDVIPILFTCTVIRHNECTSVKSFARFTKATIIGIMSLV